MEHPLIAVGLRRGPVPLFHQIAEALRYRIATGRLVPGDRLPPIRRAAASWGVHMHTVRRAYGELAREGLVETKVPEGTRVATSAPSAHSQSSATEAFVVRMIAEAEREHGLTVDQLATLIRAWPPPVPGPPTVHLIECSLAQARGHCSEIESAWHVRAQPLSLESSTGELPGGNLVATYFHYAEIQARWPQRVEHIRFVPIRPDPALASRLPAPGPDAVVVPLCERDESKAFHIAADLGSLLPPHLRVEPRVVDRADELLASDDPGPVLFSPRLWGSLSREQRHDPRAFEVRYLIDTDALAALGRHFSWASRKEHR